jgi:hypothetical protein
MEEKMGLNTHLRRKGGVYHWRRRIPIDLAPILGRHEFVRSLHTRNPSMARRRARALSLIVDHAVEMAEIGDPISKAKLDALIRERFRFMLEVDEESRTSKRPRQSEYFTAYRGTDPARDDRALLGELGQQAQEELSENDLRRATPYAERIADDANLQLADQPDTLPYLARGYLRAEVEFYRMVQARRAGIYGIKPADPLFSQAAPSRAEEASENSSPTFLEAVDRYLEYRRKDQTQTGHQLGQIAPTLREFAALHGELRLAEIRTKHLVELREKLRELPSKHGQLRDWKSLSFTEKLDKASGEEFKGKVITYKTIKRKFSELSGLFEWAREREYLKENPTAGFRWPKSEAAREQGTHYRIDELSVLFRQPIWTGSQKAHRNKPGPHTIRDARFWLPLAALFSGLRLGEVAQLTPGDVGEEVTCPC